MKTPIELFMEGEEILAKQHAEKEVEKIGVFRGGSAGCLLPDNTYIGDIYKDMARYIGLQRGIQMKNYMQEGLDSEETWAKNIKATGVAFRCEEDIPVRYEFDGKYIATGRPDLVVGAESKIMETTCFSPKYGVELKTKNTTKTVASVLLGNKLDPTYLCQAGFYSKALKVPYYLVHTANVSGELGYWDKKEYGVYDVATGKRQSKIDWVNDTLHVDGKPTIITFEGILDYWRVIGEMVERQQMVSLRNASCDAFGKPLPYDLNDYQEFPLVADVEQSFAGWKEDIEMYCKVPDRYSLKYKTKNKVGYYAVMETDYSLKDGLLYPEVTMETFGDLGEAREYFLGLAEG